MNAPARQPDRREDVEPSPTTRHPLGSALGWVVVGALFVAMQVGVVWGMQRGRDWALADLGSAQQQQNWEEWRDEVRQDQASQESSVARRVPKSGEPPGLVLMRDHYPTCLVAAVVFSTAVFAMTIFLVGGVFATKRT